MHFTRLISRSVSLRLAVSLCLAVSFCLAVFCLPASANEQQDQQIEFFERKIRPVLVQHCYECHSGDSDVIQGGLRLDHPDAMVRGGDNGAAVMPGEPEKSLLLAAIRYEEMEMPPDGKLSEAVAQDFEKWIALGAADPRANDSLPQSNPASDIDWDQARAFWSFQEPIKHQPPSAKATDWAAGKIDAFVLHRLESAGIAPNAAADRQTLIRRVTFDLTGLPPTPRDVERFLSDDSPTSYQRLIERLLSDPRRAERWSRMWLDVVRYAEDQAHIVGGNDSLTYPNAYRYRDWVISALAGDMPFDQFIKLQLAADLIVPDDQDAHLALGLLGLGPKYYRRNDPTVMADEWEDRIDTVSRGLIGLTVACARCHDHKFDPIPTSDYYALAGVFAGTEMFNRPINDTVEKQTGKKKKGEAKKPQDAVHIVREGKPTDIAIQIRGDATNKGPLVERTFLTVLSKQPIPLSNGSGRGDLANAIADRKNPLTARVIVNRIWMQLMGAPLVATPSNFGKFGSRPTHPQLLDDLSVRFMENDWSLKWLQREIVLSSTYRQSSDIDPAKAAIDPENTLRWRMNRRRLSAEGYRDALLAVAGRMETSIGGVSIEPDTKDSRRRTLYSKISRLGLNPLLARFDFPDPNAHSAKRHETTTPLQKLFLLNSPFLIAQSTALSDRIPITSQSHQSAIQTAYQTLYARQPTRQEITLGENYLLDGSQQAWPQYLQALLISNEMFMID
ncbi:PSD1 and planctomycete cytochrome C domain-containing protein [Planctomycetes bacterium K23_9]|uniref:Planctomycete cytochrome C n=1 Tax=Stieleria marina TaxID=1930275 RepID=A0A517NQS6_9BACT|nr:Planctomycete cytochrome C [Planctomycetes bacterium K23_9]